MDADRRCQVAAVGRRLLPLLERAVTESWADLVPAAAAWGPPTRRWAQEASRAALRALLTVFEQGDLDDRSWQRLRALMFGDANSTHDEAADLLRSVRIVGVEVLTRHLAAEVALAHEERCQLQREAAGFCSELLGARDELDGASFDRLLADLEASGPDVT